MKDSFQRFLSTKSKTQTDSETTNFRWVAIAFVCTIFIVSQFLGAATFAADSISLEKSALSDGLAASSMEVGTIPGEFAVNGNGGATYTIPIEVPPGTNGVQPNLSLVYNSQQDNGLLGVGWNLAGLSAIARCGTTVATDGFKSGVNFDSRDRFCFDGQRLMAVSGAYGADGTEYHTERETWVRIISQTEAGQNGPRSFSVTTKDGHRLEFGTTPESRILARDRVDGAVRVWGLNKISDRNGNFVEIEYREDRSKIAEEIKGGFLGYFPTEIRYTGNSNGSLAPQRLVTFEYQDRRDKIKNYIAGSPAETTRRLTHIRTYVDLDGDGQNLAAVPNLVKNYRLNYEYGSVTGRSRLTQIEECDAKGKCLPATRVGWTASKLEEFSGELNLLSEQFRDIFNASGVEKIAGDFNGDGLTDIAGFGQTRWSNDTYAFLLGQRNGKFVEKALTPPPNLPPKLNLPGKKIAGDFNGDGLTDIAYPFLNNDEGVEELYILFPKKDGTLRAERRRIFGSPCNIRASGSQIITGDFNGDGRTDIAGFPVGIREPVLCSRGMIFISKGDGNFEQKIPSSELLNRGQAQRIAGDFNGDGLTDLASFLKNDSSRLLLILFPEIDRNGIYRFTETRTLLSSDMFNDLSRDETQIVTGNFNGDSLTDIGVFFRGTYTASVPVLLSKGNGNFEEKNDNSFKYRSSFLGIPGDFNGDGLTDIAGLLDQIFLYIPVLFSKGDGGFQGKEIKLPAPYQFVINNPRGEKVFGDFNGDDLSEISAPETSGASPTIFLPDTSQELVASITNGLGEQIAIEYKPLTDETVYRKGSKATYPLADIQAPTYVVSKHILRDREDSPGNAFVFEHKYEEAKVNYERGWLGFEKTILIDRQNNTETITTHRTDFPFLGAIAEREIKDLAHGGRVLGKTTSKYDSDPKNEYGIYKFWQTEVAIDHYTEGNYNFTLKRTYQYDENYQNAIAIGDLGDAANPDDDVYTCIAYAEGSGANFWQSFFPTQQKIVRRAESCKNLTDWDAESDLRWEQFGYDERMNLTARRNWRDRGSLTDRQGKWLTARIGYDGFGNMTTLTDTLENTSYITYENKYYTFPREHRTPSPSANRPPLVVSTTYEPKFGIKTQSIDPNGHIAMQIDRGEIDGFGRVLAIQGIKPNSSDLLTLAKTEFLSEEGGGMSIKTWYRTKWDGSDIPDESWLWEREYIDGLGRTYQVKSKGENGKVLTETVAFNAVGQVERESLPYYIGEKPHFFTHQYNIHGFRIETTNPVGAISKTDFENLNDREITYRVPDPRDDRDGTNLISSLVEETSRGWTKLERQADDSTALYDYDPLGELKTITDPLGQDTIAVYNSLGQVLSTTTRETGRTQYRYNDNGKLVNQIDAKGQRISFDYDRLGRLSQKRVYNSDSSLAETITYEYDDPSIENGKGALTKIVMPEAIYTFAYDNRGQLKAEKVEMDTRGDGSRKTYISRYTYDAAGRPQTITYPDGAIVRHTYNEAGELQTIALKDIGETDFRIYAIYEDYTALGDFRKVTYGNQVESNYQYDSIGRIATNTTSKGAYTYSNFEYEWNKANKLLRITDIADNDKPDRSQIFTYDINGRLKIAEGPYGGLKYDYDRAGNITQRNDRVYRYKPDKQHQLLEATYDDNGNTTALNPWRYTYDAQNRLLRVDRSNTTVNAFTYDSLGNRLSKTESQDGKTTYYVTSLYEVVRQTGDAEADSQFVHTKYIVGPEGAIAAISKSDRDFNLTAAIGANNAKLAAGLYNPHSGGGLPRFLSAKFNQFISVGPIGPMLFVLAFVGSLLCTLSIWLYRYKRWAGLGEGRISSQMAIAKTQGWLLQNWHRPIAFVLAFVSFFTVSFSGSIALADTTSGMGERGYPIPGRTLFFHSDHLGSTSLVTDVHANEVSQLDYEPYGEMVEPPNEDIFRPKFTGKEYDSNSGLYYFGSRYYNGHLGRFLTPDPAGQYFSPYVYGNGDPLSGIDPTGSQFVILAIAIGVVVAAGVGAYLGGAAVNHSMNPASWDWSSGKTWGGIALGAAIGFVTSAAGIFASSVIAAAGLGALGTAVADMVVAGGMMGVMNASFTAMGGGSIGEIAASFAKGFAMGALFAIPYVGAVAFVGMAGYDAYQFVVNPSVGNGIQLGMDILFLGMAAGARLGRGSKGYMEGEGSRAMEERQGLLEEGYADNTSCASFVAGTLVVMPEGYKPIEEIEVGDLVLAYDEETGEVGEYPVSHLFSRIAPETVLLTVGDEAIQTTPKHEFYTDKGWLKALKLDDTVGIASREKIKKYAQKSYRIEKKVEVWNFEVQKLHNYFITKEELLVHNPKCPVRVENARLKLEVWDKEVNLGEFTSGEEGGKSVSEEYKKQALKLDGYKRHVDAEAQLFSTADEVLSSITTFGSSKNRNVKGSLSFTVTRKLCLSCKGLLEHFTSKWPNITVNYKVNPRILKPKFIKVKY
ncbi:MAG: FG-GAP-like repeat-containing protein [Cyanobacteria bacterium P01_E01_bin.42]